MEWRENVSRLHTTIKDVTPIPPEIRFLRPAWGKLTVSISLLCVPYKILERLIYTRVEPLIDPLLPKEQAGFRHGKSTVDQVVLLIQNIEDSFEAKKKAGAVFIDLTAAYDTVWHRGLTCKLLRLLPDKHMVKMIMELVRN